MNLTTLPKITERRLKRVGRGIGSGKGGHTTGRGTKGQKARERVPQQFEGMKWKKSMIKRLPALRGENKFKAWGKHFVAISLTKMAEWPAKTHVTDEALVKSGMLRVGEHGKLVGKHAMKSALTVAIATSAGAKESIVAAGGTIEENK